MPKTPALMPVECENTVLRGPGGPAIDCGKPATHTVAYDSLKWRGGLDEFFMCDDCLAYVRDGEVGAERLSEPGWAPMEGYDG